MKSKNIWKFGFNWGSTIGGAYFLYNIIIFLLGIREGFIWGLLGFFIIVFGITRAISVYKRVLNLDSISFGKSFKVGTIICIFISLFSTLFMALYIYRLQPNFFNNFLEIYQNTLDSFGYDIDVYNNAKVLNLIEYGLIPTLYLGNLLQNLFYLLIISLASSLQGYPPNFTKKGISKDNDYVPYNEIKEENNTKTEENNENSDAQKEDAENQNEDIQK